MTPIHPPSNQRRESRLTADTPVALTLLKVLGEPVLSGRVIDMSGGGLRASVPLPIPCGAEVKVEAQGLVILGTVCRCEDHDGSYAVGLVLSEVGSR